MESQINLAGVTLEHPLMNAAGTCKTLEQVRDFARSAVSAITVGSITVEPRKGNSGNVYYQGKGYSLSALGMPNPGADYYREHLPEMVALAHGAHKPLAISVAGFNPDQYGRLADIAVDAEVDLVELNLGCPNVWASGEQKPIPSFDPEAIRQIINHTNGLQDRRVGVKLSPYSDPGKLVEVAAVLSELPVRYVVCCNTFPNALVLENSTPVIGVGFGGLAGNAMLPIGLGQVMQFREHLDERIQIVGVGGITHGPHIRHYLAAGASAVQASTPYWNAGENPVIYSTILLTY